MKKISLFLIFVVLLGSASAEGAATTAASPNALLSFSVIPNITYPVWPPGNLKNLYTLLGQHSMFTPSVGATLACRYRLASSSLFIGADFGYSWVGMDSDASMSMSMLQAGLGAGLHLNILPTLGLRCFGSVGYSYNLVQSGLVTSHENWLALLLPLDYVVARGGTPFVGAGAELSWSFIPSLSLDAGIKFRYFFDLYADLGATLGISYNLPVGGQRTAKPATQRAAPLKSASHPLAPIEHAPAAMESLSLFLKPQEPTVILLSERISSTVKPYMNHTIDKNLQSAVGFHEALRLLGIAYAPCAESGTAADSVKSPLQTLQDRSGDCRDLSVLFSSLFESLEVDTAFVTTPGHVFIAFALASSEEETRRTFSHMEELLFRDGKVWVPIDVTQREGSFLEAWQAGLAEWRKAKKQARFYPVRATENTQQSADSLGSGSQPLLLDHAQVISGFQEEMKRLVDREIHDRETELMAAVIQSNGSPKALNALGVLYARWDLLEKAEVQFQAAVEKSEYAPALVNLGNLLLLRNLPEEALGLYQRAAAVAPYDQAVLLGLTRSYHRLQNWELVQEEYGELQKQNPRLAEQFSYLRVPRAEAVATAEVMVWGDE
jgi:tetratricopeptide (TPR) repeat protein